MWESLQLAVPDFIEYLRSLPRGELLLIKSLFIAATAGVFAVTLGAWAIAFTLVHSLAARLIWRGGFLLALIILFGCSLQASIGILKSDDPFPGRPLTGISELVVLFTLFSVVMLLVSAWKSLTWRAGNGKTMARKQRA